MEQYRTEKQGNAVTVWDDTEGVGLRFIEGETLQRYTHEIVLRSVDLPDLEHLNRITAALEDWAAARYPKEFAPIKTGDVLERMAEIENRQAEYLAATKAEVEALRKAIEKETTKK
jgi:hypothetical protein